MPAPTGFYQGVIPAQPGHRRGAIRISPLYRIRLMTGLDWVHPWSEWTTVFAGLLLSGAAIGCLIVAYLLSRRPPAPLDWFAICSAGGIAVMFFIPSQFHYHF